MTAPADHGNADEMAERDKKSGAPLLDERGRVRAKTSHTLNPVPCHVYAPSVALAAAPGIERPGLANVAASALYLMGFAAPEGSSPSLVAVAR